MLHCKPALYLLSFVPLAFVTPVMLVRVIEAVESGQLRSGPAVRLIGCFLAEIPPCEVVRRLGNALA